MLLLQERDRAGNAKSYMLKRFLTTQYFHYSRVYAEVLINTSKLTSEPIDNYEKLDIGERNVSISGNADVIFF